MTSQAENARKAQREAFLREALARKDGRAFFQELLDSTGLFQSSFAGENALLTAYNEGRRSIGLALYREVLTVSPQALITVGIESFIQEADTDE